ncbi:hypothetical protein N7522_009290 [Penicillium canescens]|nr:hypothetical protein N7522_009290 [Penicillium canescens]
MPEHVGVVPPPVGVTANFDYSHPWLWNANISLITVGLILSFLCLVLRVYTKSRLLGKLGWDDDVLAGVLSWDSNNVYLWVKSSNLISSLAMY